MGVSNVYHSVESHSHASCHNCFTDFWNRPLGELALNTDEQALAQEFTQRFSSTPAGWRPLAHYVWQHVSTWVPKFFYFDDYYLLPGKVNLPSLQARVKAAAKNNQRLSSEDATVLGLLRMAGVNLEHLTVAAGYENIRAGLESISNSITDRVFEYWKQNTELEVVFDITEDSTDEAPDNSGSNLYIRIRNQRHRVTVPFSQRSKGFIWFFR